VSDLYIPRIYIFPAIYIFPGLDSVLEVTVLFLGIHKWEPDIYIGFSPALHLQCGGNKNKIKVIFFSAEARFMNVQFC
jgi:hypothetical protein